MGNALFFTAKKTILHAEAKKECTNNYKDVSHMKIGEAQQKYRAQVRSYREQRSALSKQLEDVRTKLQYLPDDKEHREKFESEAASLQLTMDALDEKQSEYEKYLEQLSEKYCAYWNATVAEQQKDASKEYAADVAKVMEVARRLMKGAIVPASDEKKLMDFSMDMYQVAKNVGAMARLEKREKYDSLWEDDEEKKEYDDPRETAENADAGAGAPEIVDVADTMASAGAV